jgi:hypothetical protein
MPYGRHSALNRWIAPVLLALALASGLAAGPCRAQEAGSIRQVWILVDVEDDSSGKVQVQVPLEWVKHDRSLTTCKEHGERRGIDGRALYRKFKDLAEGEEQTVDSYSCHDSEVTVRVKSERLETGPPARKIRVLVRGRDGDNVDIALNLDAATFLGKLFSGAAFSFTDDEDEAIRPLLDGDLGLLRGLPPFDLVRVHDRGESVVIRTE